MGVRQNQWLAASSLASGLSVASFLMAPALSAALVLSLVSVPIAIVCGFFGAPRTALVAMYFGVGAWFPLWLPKELSLTFEQVYIGILAGGVAVILAATLWRRSNTQTV